MTTSSNSKSFYNGKRYVRAWLEAVISSNANGSVTIKWDAKAQFKQAYHYGVKVTCYIDGDSVGSDTGYLTSNPGNTWKTAASKSGSKTISKTKSEQTIPVKVTAKLQSVNGYGGNYGSVSTTINMKIGAKTKYTVSFSGNGGSGCPGSQTKWYGEDLALSSTRPTRTGYRFTGWGVSNRSDIGSEYKTSPYYQPGSTVAYNGNQTLVAIWEELTYTVSYSANGGTGAPGNQTKRYFSDVKVSSVTPTYEGHRFLYWASSSSKKYNPGDTYSENSNNTLTAVWTDNQYIIRYNSNGGDTAPAAQEKSHDQAITITTEKPTRKRYNFVGWATSATGSVEYHGGESYTANEDLTLYAVWELSASKLTVYDSDGKSHTGLCYIYDANGTMHYGIITIYDTDGKPHTVV